MIAGKPTAWRFGLVGGVGLAGAGLMKAMRVFLKVKAAGFTLGDELMFLSYLFGMGFAGGLIAWYLRFLPRKYGIPGEALLGAILMNLFFVCCAAVFDATLILGNLDHLVWLFGFASLLGAFAGILIGKDFRPTND